MTLIAYAPPKINVSLKITGRREDGYHLLESIVVFGADNSGDVVQYMPEAAFGLTVSGAFADKVPSDGSNLILKICEIMNEQRILSGQTALQFGGFTLEKNLPIASGIGGGTMDAMAALKLIQQHHQLSDEFCLHCAQILGADGVACWHSKPLIMHGIGEQIKLLPENALNSLPKFCVLLNANVAVSTPEVFKVLHENPLSLRERVPDRAGEGENSTLAPHPSLRATFSQREKGYSFLIQDLHALGNDLQLPAIQICPGISDVLAYLTQNSADYAAMSGSGGTCFGLFETESAAQNAFNNAPQNWWKSVFSLQ